MHDLKNTMIETETDVLTELKEQLVEPQNLVLFNDPHNTFEYVIEALIKVCSHEPVQAEQCTYIVHYSGKCAVKRGSWDKLEPMCTALLDRGLTAEIV